MDQLLLTIKNSENGNMESPNNTVDNFDDTSKIMERIHAEPSHVSVLYKIIDYCKMARSLAEVKQEVGAYPEMSASLHSPSVLLAWMVQVRAIEEILGKDGASAWRTTSAGRNVLRLACPDERLSHLVAQSGSYRNIYHLLLEACLEPETRSGIEALLQGNPLLEDPKVSPSFFIGELEVAGGLGWEGKWKTTPAGAKFLDTWFARG